MLPAFTGPLPGLWVGPGQAMPETIEKLSIEKLTSEVANMTTQTVMSAAGGTETVSLAAAILNHSVALKDNSVAINQVHTAIHNLEMRFEKFEAKLAQIETEQARLAGYVEGIANGGQGSMEDRLKLTLTVNGLEIDKKIKVISDEHKELKNTIEQLKKGGFVRSASPLTEYEGAYHVPLFRGMEGASP